MYLQIIGLPASIQKWIMTFFYSNVAGQATRNNN